MVHTADPLVVAYLFTAVVTAVVAWRTLQHRHVPGARPFGVVLAAVTVWTLLSAMLQHPLFQGSVVYSFLVRVVWLPTGVVAVAWLAFGLAYTGREAVLTPRFVGVLSVVPAVTVLVGLTHPILLDQYAAWLAPVGLDGVVATVRPVAQAWDTVSLVAWGYTYLLVGAGTLFLLEVIVERPVAHPGQLLMLAVVAPPWALNAAHLFVFDFQSFNPTILGFAVSGVAGLFAVGRFKLFDVPLARARVVEDLDSGVLVYGPDGLVYDYNERAESLLGLDDDAPGTDVRDLLAASPLALEFPEEHLPVGVHDDADGVPDRESGAPGETLEAHLDGRTVPVEGEDAYVEVRLSTLSNVVDRSVSCVVRLYDVTERERRERELRRKNELLDEFASVVSHDVATPLGVIENKAHLAEMTGDTEHVADVHEATERVQRLVDDLRELARQGKEVGETRPVDVATVAREAWSTVESRGATLAVDASRTVDADPDRLRQLFENLFENAVEHGSTPSPADAVEHAVAESSTDDPSDDRIERESGSADSQTRQAVPDAAADEVDPLPEAEESWSTLTVTVGTFPGGFYVADDGPGIPESDRDRVFAQGVTTDEDSTGLGLAIVRRIAEGHGWSVSVTESAEGGARFELRTDG